MKYAIYLFLLIATVGCNTSSDLPEVPVKYLDGSSQDMSEIDGPAVVVLYQPSCDHCQVAAAEVQKTLANFDGYKLYFISNAPLYETKQFADTYKLSNQSNVHFGTTLGDYIIENFGAVPTPSFYIYNEDGKLLTELVGETQIDKVLAAL